MIEKTKEVRKHEISEELEEVVREARELAKEFGLNPRPVNYWVIDHDEMNELIAYGGFQKRYPHWRWGMQYDRQQKKSQYFGGKAFEIVNNDTPAHAFLQMSNSIADQKAVITHVEAHSDFFANNEWFQNDPNASEMLEANAEKIEGYMRDPDIDREEVERWIDHAYCLVDNIDQYSNFRYRDQDESEEDIEEEENEGISQYLSDRIERMVFSDDDNDADPEHFIEETHSDILAFLIQNGETYDEKMDRAIEMEEWQIDVLDMIREEAYYFAPQKMTKCMNEGWAAFWESMMMGNENFAGDDEVITYADHQAKVLNSPGFNPYNLGKNLWEHVENTVNRREVVSRLLRIDGVDPNNFHNSIDFQLVHETLNHPDSDDIVKRHYSLTRIQNQGFVQDIGLDELRKMNRYIMQTDVYDDIEGALEDVNYSAGWDRMREVRETHNDPMFIDEFLTQEFVDDQEYFTWEYRVADDQPEMASREVEDVRKKLLLQLTNFGKPTMEIASGNYNNSGELFLVHKYNGVIINLDQAMETMKRIFQMWGRPVNLATVGKKVTDEQLDYAYSEGEEPDVEEVPVRIRYDGDSFSEHDILDDQVVDTLMAEELDYDTKPEQWL